MSNFEDCYSIDEVFDHCSDNEKIEFVQLLAEENPGLQTGFHHSEAEILKSSIAIMGNWRSLSSEDEETINRIGKKFRSN